MAKQTTSPQSNSNTDPMAQRPDYIAKQNYDLPVDGQARFPRLLLIQAMSPQKTKGNEKYIPGLEEGSLLFQSDTTTRIIDGETGIVVIPLAIRKRYVEYVPRDAGGGFVASYDTKEEMEVNRDATNDIQTTIEYLCIEAGVDDPTPFIITFDTISKLGTAEKWAQFIKQYQTMEGVKYLIIGKQKLNKKKQPYYIYDIQPVGWVDKKVLDYVQGVSQGLLPLFNHAINEEI